MASSAAATSREEEPERIDYQPPATWASDLQVLRSMVFADVRGESQQERLESFYTSQASLYDSYRCRMLHGRLPMVKAMPAPKGGTWVDLGGGTGSNLEFFGEKLNHWGKVVVLDFCPALVKTAKERVAQHPGWESFVDVVLGDACDQNNTELPAAGTVDVVTFSYALTMIPDWKGAIQNALRLLKPGGHIAVCDFTVSYEKQWAGMPEFWKWTFSNDHVFLNEEHIQTLKAEFDEKTLHVDLGMFPYLPLLQCPYYYFVGQKRMSS